MQSESKMIRHSKSNIKAKQAKKVPTQNQQDVKRLALTLAHLCLLMVFVLGGEGGVLWHLWCVVSVRVDGELRWLGVKKKLCNLQTMDL